MDALGVAGLFSNPFVFSFQLKQIENEEAPANEVSKFCRRYSRPLYNQQHVAQAQARYRTKCIHAIFELHVKMICKSRE